MSIGLLPPRQREIAKMIAKGLKNKEIAELLGLTQNNVAMHKTLLKRRLGVGTDDEIVALAAISAPMAVTEPALPPEIDVRPDDYVSPRLREALDAAQEAPPRRKRTLFFHVTRGPARTMV